MTSLIAMSASVAIYLLWDLYHHERVRKPACKEIDSGLLYLRQKRAVLQRVTSSRLRATLK